MVIPALRDATNDHALRGAPLTVLVWLLNNVLDPMDFRPLKLAGLAVSLRMNRNTVAGALRLLTRRGYLEREYRFHQGYAYRACWTRRPPAVEVPETRRTRAAE